MNSADNAELKKDIAEHEAKLEKAKADRDAAKDWRVSMLACDSIIRHMICIDRLRAQLDR